MGRNDNPNAVEFSSAFKKLLICHPLVTSVDHNVITNATGILTVSSHKVVKQVIESPGVEDQVEELELDYEAVMLTEIQEAEPYEQHMWAYIALCVEENFIQNTKNHKYKCSACADILLCEDEKINDELLSMKTREDGQIQQPSISTLKVITFANAVMKIYSDQHHSQNTLNIIRKSIIKNIDIDDLYNNDNFSHQGHEQVDHKEKFIS